MISRDKVLIRINPKKRARLEFSQNNGRVWHSRYSGGIFGDFLDLTDTGKEILATTSKGLFFSKDEGRTWHKRN